MSRLLKMAAVIGLAASLSGCILPPWWGGPGGGGHGGGGPGGGGGGPHFGFSQPR